MERRCTRSWIRSYILNIALTTDFLLGKLADLIEELKRFPTSGDLRIKGRNDKNFPSHNSFSRYGNKSGLANAFKIYCNQNAKVDLIEYCVPYLNKETEPIDNSEILEDSGSVYLYNLVNIYKIGRTNNLRRRDREIKLHITYRS